MHIYIRAEQKARLCGLLSVTSVSACRASWHLGLISLCGVLPLVNLTSLLIASEASLVKVVLLPLAPYNLSIKVYKSVAYSILKVLCNYHHNFRTFYP